MAMSNVLDETKQQQVIALGRLGWSLRRIEGATGVRRETVSGYLKAAGIAVRGRGGRPAQWPPPNPATTSEVSTDSADTSVATVMSGQAATASLCEPYRALIVEGLQRSRNAMAIWQDLVDQHGFSGCASTPKFPQLMNRQIPAVAGNQTERVVSARGPSLVGLSRAPSSRSR